MLAGFECGVRVLQRFFLLFGEWSGGVERVNQRLEFDLVVDCGIELGTYRAHFDAAALRGEEDAFGAGDHARHFARAGEQAARGVEALAGDDVAVGAAAYGDLHVVSRGRIAKRVVRLADAELLEEARKLGAELDFSV